MKGRIQKETVAYKHRKKFAVHLLVALVFSVALGALAFYSYKFINNILSSRVSIHTVEKLWNGGNNPDYENVYKVSEQILQDNPLHNAALTYHGYAAFRLAMEQLDTTAKQNYLDIAINNMRVALETAQKRLMPQLEYVLGMAYFYKNTVDSYYYSDLAVKYLTLAKEHGYQDDYIAEYLGLSYAALGMTEESISSFADALNVRESDSLWLSIAEQYYKAGNNRAAKPYLKRTIDSSENDDLVLSGKLLLANIFLDEKNYDAAENEFIDIIAKNENSAEAHYGLGTVYEKQGDMARARAERRKALRIQPNYVPATNNLERGN